MTLDITKVANVILYMLHKQVKLLNDKKLSILLFLMDYNHQKFCGKKIFGDEYIKGSRSPEPRLLSELFEVIASEQILEDDDERVYLIQEILDNVDIDIIERENFIELKFIEIGVEYDESLFDEEELKTINKLVLQYKDATPRLIANDTFKIDEYRAKEKGEVVL
ncbi:type II toxin-antitoxin system antitoxin SocA domain-containing protein [Arcobacter sp.]|uniref:type II toxin-antitoxin system antitoxin SocA domain-containing protein n=1 Tax=Arcobacter sp. TaxID=1872629 RepID=UPI003D0ADC5E